MYLNFLCFKLGSTALGIQTQEGVVLACEKRLTSTLMEPTSMEKIMKIDKHIGIQTKRNCNNAAIPTLLNFRIVLTVL